MKLSRSQKMVLLAMWWAMPRGTSGVEIAERMGLGASSVYPALSALADRGLAVVCDPPSEAEAKSSAGRPRTFFMLTGSGQREAQRLEQEVESSFALVKARLGV